MKRQHVGLREQRVQRARLDLLVGPRGSRRRQLRIEPDRAHAEGAAEARGQAADAAEADDAERLPADLATIGQRAAAATCPAATSAVEPYAPRNSSIAVPITYSATASAFAPVAGITVRPRDSQVATSMLSRPTPRRPDDLQARRRREQLGVHLRAVADDQRVRVDDPALQHLAPIDELRVV